jgi:RNA methyltransferase, TrmH family
VTTTVLTSTRNPRVRAASELRTRRSREAAGLTLVDGIREISRALDAGARIHELFTDTHPDREADAVADRARAAGAAIITVDPRVLDHLGYGGRSGSPVAVVEVPSVELAAIELPADPLVIVIEAVEKPGNLGAVLRTADAAGASCVIAADPRTDLFNPNTIRASLGTVFALPVAAAPGHIVRSWLREHALRVVATRVDGAVAWSDADLSGPVAIVLGSESEGLTNMWTGDEIDSVRLPMLGAGDSLNVSITAAVLLYEARRQRLGSDRRATAPSAAPPPTRLDRTVTATRAR